MGNNLFTFATSELSQDAFFAWLLAWADKSYVGTSMNECARMFFNNVLLQGSGRCLPSECSVEVKRQYKNIDIFCRVDDRLAIVIEDKIGICEHSNQLQRYRQTILNDGYAPESIVCVYLKTRDQSDLSGVYKAGYAVVDRQRLLAFFRSAAIDGFVHGNDILCDFVETLESIDKSVESYLTLPLDKWYWDSWVGFYVALQKRFAGRWAYVANPSGGFLGFWWFFHEVDGGEVYLQLEEGKACFKATVFELDDADKLKWRWHYAFIDAGKKLGVEVVPPVRMRRGGYMTVAVLNGDSRVKKDDGALDFERTCERLLSMQNVLTCAIESQKDS